MLESLLKSAEIRDYLSNFPRSDWFQCIEATLRVGIREIRTATDSGLRLDQVVKRLKAQGTVVPSLKEKMTTLRQELDGLRRDLGEETGARRHASPVKGGNRRIRTKSKPMKKTLSRQLQMIESAMSSATARTSTPPQLLKSPDLPYSSDTATLWSNRVSLRLKEPRTNPDMLSSLSSEPDYSDTFSPVLAIADEFLNNPLVSELALSSFSIA
jgi:hypothetical protein